DGRPPGRPGRELGGPVATRHGHHRDRAIAGARAGAGGRMKQRTAVAIAWSVWTLSMVALFVPFAYRLTGHRVAGLGDQSGSIAPVVAVLLFIPIFATVGAVLAAKRPTNPVGWLVSASGLCYGLGTFAILVGHFST